jgi:hypothetical protein
MTMRAREVQNAPTGLVGVLLPRIVQTNSLPGRDKRRGEIAPERFFFGGDWTLPFWFDADW